jgi:hypothetical protein
MGNPNTGKALKKLYPTKKHDIDYTVVDRGDGNGANIEMWNIAGPQPTDAEINQAASDYDDDVTAVGTDLDAKKEALKTALGLTEDEIIDLIYLCRNYVLA